MQINDYMLNTKIVFVWAKIADSMPTYYSILFPLKMASTHWGRVTHICVSKLPIVDSDNGLSPGWRQAII